MLRGAGENFLNESRTIKNIDNTFFFNLKGNVMWSLPTLKPSLQEKKIWIESEVI